MSDLVKRLRGWPLSINGPFTEQLCNEAADRIDNQEFIIKCKDSRIEELEEEARHMLYGDHEDEPTETDGYAD